MSATCSLLAKGEGPPGYVKYLQCVNEKKSSLKKKKEKRSLFPQMLRISFKLKQDYIHIITP